MRFDSSDAHQFESLSIRIGFSFSIIIKNIFDLHWTWLTSKIKRTLTRVSFLFCCDSVRIEPSPNLRANLDWVRIFDQDRCQLASKRSGENSSRSEPSRMLLCGKSTGHLLLFEASETDLYQDKHTPRCQMFLKYL